MKFAREKKRLLLGWCGEKGEKRKYHFPYLHVFQIIQNGGKYYIIVNNQSIINHEGIRQNVTDRSSTYSAVENHKQHTKWDEKGEKRESGQKAYTKNASRAWEGIIHLSFGVCFGFVFLWCFSLFWCWIFNEKKKFIERITNLNAAHNKQTRKQTENFSEKSNDQMCRFEIAWGNVSQVLKFVEVEIEKLLSQQRVYDVTWKNKRWFSALFSSRLLSLFFIFSIASTSLQPA